MSCPGSLCLCLLHCANHYVLPNEGHLWGRAVKMPLPFFSPVHWYGAVFRSALPNALCPVFLSDSSTCFFPTPAYVLFLVSDHSLQQDRRCRFLPMTWSRLHLEKRESLLPFPCLYLIKWPYLSLRGVWIVSKRDKKGKHCQKCDF